MPNAPIPYTLMVSSQVPQIVLLSLEAGQCRQNGVNPADEHY
ncbi:MAG: hypothetical protein RMY16_24005 [Nostoc sp. DedQUE12b]|nr:hypothetical protein [Nostoc sp. DedQUE12b]MDZ8088597.1 hypothetical protein [Nostoc sp. DedQUE12b]